MLLKIRFVENSIPTASTKYINNLTDTRESSNPTEPHISSDCHRLPHSLMWFLRHHHLHNL